MLFFLLWQALIEKKLAKTRSIRKIEGIIPMALEIFNTLSGQKQEFVPLRAGEVQMYICGVTVYDSSHFGHRRFLLTLFSR
jgi:hypothetical protein